MSDSISHLLSQAAEEQAAESRVLSTSLAQIRERVTQLSEQVAGLAQLQEAVRAVETEVRQSTTLLADRINNPGTTQTAAPAATDDVARLVAESEQRILAHVDGAVLNLAKALLLGHRAGVDPALAEPLPEPAAPKAAGRLSRGKEPAAPEIPAETTAAVGELPVATPPDSPSDRPTVTPSLAETAELATDQPLRPADPRRGRWRQTGG